MEDVACEMYVLINQLTLVCNMQWNVLDGLAEAMKALDGKNGRCCMRIDRVDDLVKRKRRRCKKTSSFGNLACYKVVSLFSTDLVSKAISEDCSEGDICSILENSALMSFLGGVEKKNVRRRFQRNRSDEEATTTIAYMAINLMNRAAVSPNLAKNLFQSLLEGCRGMCPNLRNSGG